MRLKAYEKMNHLERMEYWIESAYYWLDKNKIRKAANDFEMANMKMEDAISAGERAQ